MGKDRERSERRGQRIAKKRDYTRKKNVDLVAKVLEERIAEVRNAHTVAQQKSKDGESEIALRLSLGTSLEIRRIRVEIKAMGKSKAMRDLDSALDIVDRQDTKVWASIVRDMREL